MTRLPDRYVEDRALRDAAREVLIADLEHARRSLSRTGMATRVAGRISGGAQEVIESAIEQAEEHRGIIAGLIALIIVWCARAPLLGLLGLRDESGAGDNAPDASHAAGEPRGETMARSAHSAAQPEHPDTLPITGETHD